MTPNVPESNNDSSSVSIGDKQQPPFQFRPRAQSFREGGIVSRVVITNAVPQQTELFIQPAKRDLPTRKTLIDTFVERNDQYWVCVIIYICFYYLFIFNLQQNRVDVKIDVPFTDHSHIIGRQGRNTQDVMRRTGCHIHFPDSNKNRDNEKSNQVGGKCIYLFLFNFVGDNRGCTGSS
jgi:hypothetical protein